MDEYNSIIIRLNEQFSFKANKISKERQTTEKLLLTIGKKLPWYQPWKIFLHLTEIKKATILFGTITASCLDEVISLQANQLNILQLQQALQEEIDILKGEIGDE